MDISLYFDFVKELKDYYKCLRNFGKQPPEEARHICWFNDLITDKSDEQGNSVLLKAVQENNLLKTESFLSSPQRQQLVNLPNQMGRAPVMEVRSIIAVIKLFASSGIHARMWLKLLWSKYKYYKLCQHINYFKKRKES